MGFLKVFTEHSKMIFWLAQVEATRLKHDAIGTEHILLALVRVDGTASRILKALNINTAMIESQIEELVDEGTYKGVVTSYTPHAEKVIELSVDVCYNLGRSCIDTEHILIALLREGEGVASKIFENLSISLEQIMHQILLLYTEKDLPNEENNL